jgi:hypothetical protein
VLYMFQSKHLQCLLDRLDSMTMAASIEARVPFLDHELIEFICKLSTNAIEYNAKVPIGNSWVLVAKESRNTSLDFITYEPVICIIIQGEKEVISSGEVVYAGAGQTLIITHDINVQARIEVIKIDRPYLAIIIPIDVQKLHDIALKMSFGKQEEHKQSAISVGTTSSELEDAVLRYLRFLHRPQEMEILANLKYKMTENKEAQGITLCISNGWQSPINETNMYKINGSANMKLSAENPATAHTH